ncbi:UNVERIFIED_CONTAM: hypothetical protein FKN15_023159 [Acipenser sinensis]
MRTLKRVSGCYRHQFENGTTCLQCKSLILPYNVTECSNCSDGSYPNIISTEAKICKKGKTFSHIYFSYNIISRNHKRN